MSSSHRPTIRTSLQTIDSSVNALWAFGRNTVVGWRHEANRIQVLAAPTPTVIAAFEAFPRVFRGRRRLGKGTFEQLSRHLGIEPAEFCVPAMIGTGSWEIDPDTVDNLIRRYTISYTQHRAVMLFDIVGFSRVSPLEQLAQLNSLELAINFATKRLADVGIRTDFARSTTGDGFYVWNRAKGWRHDANTLAAFILIVAQNAIDRRSGLGRGVPALRSAFSIGSHFSYHQVEGLTPRGYEYIVGDVTIALARILQVAVGGQILFGNFVRPPDTPGQSRPLDPILFLAAAEARIQKLGRSDVGNARIGDIRVSFTGSQCDGGAYDVSIYRIIDKHGVEHSAFNLKITIERPAAPAIQLGKLDGELADFAAEAARYRLDLPGR
ncbi:MAG: hypothetical protein GC191_07470 [Azospirillum sp.]|nr:hypothetical protein [Azospirillum sp.]